MSPSSIRHFGHRSTLPFNATLPIASHHKISSDPLLHALEAVFACMEFAHLGKANWTDHANLHRERCTRPTMYQWLHDRVPIEEYETGPLLTLPKKRSSFHGHSCFRNHWSAFRCPQRAAIVQRYPPLIVSNTVSLLGRSYHHCKRSTRPAATNTDTHSGSIGKSRLTIHMNKDTLILGLHGHFPNLGSHGSFQSGLSNKRFAHSADPKQWWAPSNASVQAEEQIGKPFATIHFNMSCRPTRAMSAEKEGFQIWGCRSNISVTSWRSPSAQKR